MKSILMLTVLSGLSLTREAHAFYNPSTGRWLSRDPITELGFRSLRTNKSSGLVSRDATCYCFAGNRAVNAIDRYGLAYYCSSAFVNIFVAPGQLLFNEAEMLAELRAIVPPRAGVYWDVIHENLPPGAHLGPQSDISASGNCTCLYYLRADILHSVVRLGHQIPYFDAWGYGLRWIATGYPDNVKWDFDENRNALPANWQTQNSEAGWQKLSGFIMAHEVVHAVGGSHSRGDGFIMSPAVEWNWLNQNLIPVAASTTMDVEFALLHYFLGNVTN